MAASGMPAFEQAALDSDVENMFVREVRRDSADSAQQACDPDALTPSPLVEGAGGSRRCGRAAAEPVLPAKVPVNVEINNLLKNASKRTEKAIKEARLSEQKRERATKKARDKAESLLSTEVLLGIAKGRSDVGTIMCQHCAHSIALASALPDLAPAPGKRRRTIRDGRLLIAPAARGSAPHGSAPAGQHSRSASAQLAAIEDGQASATHAASARAAPKQLNVARALQQATGAMLSDAESDFGEEKATPPAHLASDGTALLAEDSPSSHASALSEELTLG